MGNHRSNCCLSQREEELWKCQCVWMWRMPNVKKDVVHFANVSGIVEDDRNAKNKRREEWREERMSNASLVGKRLEINLQSEQSIENNIIDMAVYEDPLCDGDDHAFLVVGC